MIKFYQKSKNSDKTFEIFMKIYENFDRKNFLKILENCGERKWSDFGEKLLSNLKKTLETF